MCGSKWLYLQSHYISYHRRLACAVRHVKEWQRKEGFTYTMLLLSRNSSLLICRKEWSISNGLRLFFVQNPEIWDTRQFSDEAWFHQAEYIDLQNMCMWAAANPAIHEESFQPQKVGRMWYAVAPGSIILPISSTQSLLMCASAFTENF
jgi:hypothetical protein